MKTLKALGAALALTITPMIAYASMRAYYQSGG
jgi:hypothetical protein